MFKDPGATLSALSALFAAEKSRLRDQGDLVGVGMVEDVEHKAADRVCALAAVHPEPVVRALSAEWVPRHARGRSDAEPTTLFDVARRFARKVPLTKLVTLEADVRPYLACVIIDAIQKAGDTLEIPEGLDVRKYSREAWEAHKATLAGRTYEAYGSLSRATDKGMDPV